MNTRSVVESDLRSFAGDADAFAIENPVEDSLADALRVNAAVPIVSIGLALLGLLVQLPLFLLVHRDIIQVELATLRSVADERPTHNVDRHPISIVAGRGWPWIVGNWLLLGALLFVAPVTMVLLAAAMLVTTLTQTVRRGYGYRYVTSGVVVATIAGLVWAVMAGYVNPVVLVGLVIVAVVVMRLSIGERNEVMLEEVATLANDHDYEEVCLLTGKLHVPGMLDSAADHGLTVTDAFGQRWRTGGCPLDDDGEPLRNPTAERAGDALAKRALARSIDVALVGVAVVALVVGESIVVTVSSVGWDQQVLAGTGIAYDHLGLVSWLLVPVAYDTLTEGLWNRTPGKRLVGLRVAKRDGSAVGFRDACLRALFGWLDFLPVLYFVGVLVSLFDDDGRRLGDKVAGTVVVPTTDAAEPADASAAESDPQPSASSDGVESADGSDDTVTPSADGNTGESTPATDDTVAAAPVSESAGPTDRAPADGVSDSPVADRTSEGDTSDTDRTETGEKSDAEATERTETGENATGRRADAEWTAAALDDEE